MVHILFRGLGSRLLDIPLEAFRGQIHHGLVHDLVRESSRVGLCALEQPVGREHVQCQLLPLLVTSYTLGPRLRTDL